MGQEGNQERNSLNPVTKKAIWLQKSPRTGEVRGQYQKSAVIRPSTDRGGCSSVSGHHLITLSQGEDSLGLVVGGEVLDLLALLGLQSDPLDKVLRDHGVLHRAHLDGDGAAAEADDRDVLFHGASVVPGTISVIFCPQHITGTPVS